MELGVIGLGKMGGYMTERWQLAGHQIVAFDLDKGAVERVAQKGAKPADSLESLVKQLAAPRAIWLMVPSGDPVDQTIAKLTPFLSKGDTIIDGGNSNYKDSQRRAQELKTKGFNFIDAGTSGGIWGLKEGYSLMVGGEKDVVTRLSPIFEALAPAANQGWGHVGPAGSGHFVKMIHNGIEYALMQSYAEGLDLIRAKKEFGIDLHQVTEIWRYGSVVRSWLLDLMSDALGKNPALDGIAPYVADSGEGRWTAKEAIDLGVSTPVMNIALYQRFTTHDTEHFADRLLAVTRNEFGGHAVVKEGK